LRPSILFDYLDYWPITILPILMTLILRRSYFYEIFRNTVITFLIIIVLIFSLGHLFDAKFLSTYQFDGFFENKDLSVDEIYKLYIDFDGKLNLNTHSGLGYKADIIDLPGNIGYPETIESVVGEPKVIIFREIATSNLLKVKGWDVSLGEKNIWELDIFSMDSTFYLDNIELQPSKLTGTGDIFLGKNLNLKNLVLSGNYEVTVSKELSILVKGQSEIPESWLKASVGNLNQPDNPYTLIIEIIDGSQVIFSDG
tara:strand:- start:312 stop:1076 length:765 start_codon:yes stop_codon:yes gene_type:complete